MSQYSENGESPYLPIMLDVKDKKWRKSSTVCEEKDFSFL